MLIKTLLIKLQPLLRTIWVKSKEILRWLPLFQLILILKCLLYGPQLRVAKKIHLLFILMVIASYWEKTCLIWWIIKFQNLKLMLCMVDNIPLTLLNKKSLFFKQKATINLNSLCLLIARSLKSMEELWASGQMLYLIFLKTICTLMKNLSNTVESILWPWLCLKCLAEILKQSRNHWVWFY